LSRYERYDTRRRALHIPHPSRAGFIQGFDDAGFGMSKQTLYNYAEHYNLPWPLLPEDENDLVWVIFGQPPFDLTYARQSVARALGQPVEDIVGQPSIELLRHGVTMDEGTVDCMRRLKQDPAYKVACVEQEWVDVAEGHCQMVNMQVRYTGAHTDRFYVVAHPIGAPYVSEADLFNVQPDLFYEMKRVPPPVLAEAFRAVKGRGVGELVDTVLLLNDHPELIREYLDHTLPKYEFPGDAET
jgi:hypothetical protein